MHIAIPQTIQQLRLYRNLSQESLADALGVSTQAVSKWECGKALPDITILPRIAQFFHVSIDTLFEGILEGGEEEPTEARPYLEQNRSGWDCISETQWHGTILPDYGPFTPSEEELHLLGNLQNKTVLDKTTPRLIQFHTFKNAVNPPFLGGFSIFSTVAAWAERHPCQ